MSYQSALDRLIGQNGVVVETIPADLRGRGVIKVAGQLWSAETNWLDPIPAGADVLVMGRDNLILAVLPERI